MKKAIATNKPKSADVHSTPSTKREAAFALAGGCRHFHSTALGERDASVKQTHAALAQASTAHYTWEGTAKAGELKLGSSVDRQALIQQVVVRAGIENKRFLKEKVECVLEEMISNALFHAYRDAAGKEKYARRSTVTLGSTEIITVRFEVIDKGIFLSVTDQAGTLVFDEVAGSLKRCYGSDTQIQAKEGGAGLGTYMIFDSVTHLKFDVAPGKATTVSCWIADSRSFDPVAFSVNFFQRR